MGFKRSHTGFCPLYVLYSTVNIFILCRLKMNQVKESHRLHIFILGPISMVVNRLNHVDLDFDRKGGGRGYWSLKVHCVLHFVHKT
jgi:hypothetical protein